MKNKIDVNKATLKVKYGHGGRNRGNVIRKAQGHRAGLRFNNAIDGANPFKGVIRKGTERGLNADITEKEYQLELIRHALGEF